MMSKEELIVKINQIPKFELKQLAVKENDEYHDKEWPKAVTESDKTNILATVSRKYTLVQFKDVFLPLCAEILELSGRCIYWNGTGYLQVFPKGSEFEIDANQHIGILPDKLIKGIKQVHVGKVKELFEFLPAILAEIKVAWKQIVTKFQDYKVDADDVEALIEQLKLGKRLSKFIRKKATDDMNLWDLFVEIMVIMVKIGKRKFKTETKRQEKLEMISKKIIEYAMIMEM